MTPAAGELRGTLGLPAVSPVLAEVSAAHVIRSADALLVCRRYGGRAVGMKPAGSRASDDAREVLMIDVQPATTPAQLEQVRGLIRDYVAWHRQAHVEDLGLVERYFDPVAFETELANLPGEYASPMGEVLLAVVRGAAAGCVLMRDLGDGVAEMKRMFVPERFRGLGIGRRLGSTIVARGRFAGYSRMRLDTSHRQVAAISLYERLGFRQIAPYYAVPRDLRDWLVFFELKL
jgi:ribosomal protein S18 acetylase RimI-like enzyme